MNSPPRVSVVMAAKNYARFLPQAVASAVAQTVTDWDLVIVDDGSTDATPAAAGPFLTDPRVRYVRSDRLGQPRAKNLGVRLTRGEWVAFLDADDAWHPAKLEKQLAALAANPRAGVCYTLRTLIGEDGRGLPAAPAPPPPRGEVLAAVFEAAGGFDPDLDLSIDYDLWLRVARHTEFACVDEELTLYRTGHGNLSKRLADRVLTADSIKTRAVERRGLPVPRRLVGEGYASIYRALAYTLSRTDPAEALKWYARAAVRPGARRAETLKGAAGCVLRLATGRRGGVATGENAPANR